MKSISFEYADPKKLRVHGAFDFDKRSDGLGVRRLPAWTKSQLPQGLDVMVRMPSGVRVQLYTNATSIHLESLTTTMRTVDGSPIPVPFQLECEGELQLKHGTKGNWIKPNPKSPADYELIRGVPETIVFDGLPAHSKFCEIWLPQNAFVSLRSVSIDDDAELLDLQDDQRPHWIHYGSSISHCMEANAPTETWPAIAARLAKLCLTSFGFSGQCHLDHFVGRTIRDLPASLISMKLGINVINLNSMKERVFTPAVHGLIDTIREKQPETPITLISPIYCPSAENRPGPTIPNKEGQLQANKPSEPFDGSLTLRRIREILQEVVAIRRQAGDDQLDYFSGLELLNENEGSDLPDSLHPSPAAYIRMGERFHQRYLEKKLATL